MANPLTEEPIDKLLAKIAIPSSVGFFFHTMFNVVDTYFAGLISTEALAALSLSFPVFFIIIALGSGIASGTTALIGNALGAGDKLQARTYAIQGLSFGVLVSLLITIFGMRGAPRMFMALGAEGHYLLTCLEYMQPIFTFSIFFMLTFMFNAILNALGDTRSMRNFLVAGFLMNIILDPWFIYGGFGLPAMGVRGVAIATVIIEGCGAAYLAQRVSRTELICERCRAELIPRLKPFRDIATQGLPAALNMMTVGLGIFIITYFASRFGQAPVAAYGVCTRIEQIALLPTIGLNTATVSIVAQNRGAGLFKRIRTTIRNAQLYGCSAMLLSTIAIFSLAGSLVAIFTDDPAVIEIGRFYLKLMAFLLPAYVILYVNISALQGLKRPIYGLIIGLIRQLLLPAALFPLVTARLGVEGIWIAIFAINWSAALTTLVVAQQLVRRDACRQADICD